MAKELKLMKGNEAIAEAAIRSGCDGYFGYYNPAIRSYGAPDGRNALGENRNGSIAG